MTRSVLVVSYEHPPCPGAGGRRWLAMTNHFRARGHTVTVLASRAWGVLPDDAALDVVRVADPRGSKLARRLLRRGKLRLAGDADLVERPPPAFATKVFVPDFNVVTWLPSLAIAVARRLANRHYDCLITTSPPESTHLIGLLLGSRRPAWIADFRDGWNFEPWREPLPTRLQRGMDERLEARVVQTAEVVVGATRPIANDLRARLSGNATWVPNGWDPVAAPSSSQWETYRRSDAFTLVYTGTLSGAWGRDPEPFFRALQKVRDEYGQVVRLIHAGRIDETERALIARCGVADLVQHLGTLDRPSALALQCWADALLLITSRNASEATSKLFEYLAAGRPILALAEGNEAASIIAETRAGLAVAPEDVDAIAAALKSFASLEPKKSYSPRGVDRYTYPGLADQMLALVERAIMLRAMGAH